MAQFQVFNKSSGQLIKVDKIDPTLHAHASSDSIRNPAGGGVIVEFSKEFLADLVDQYGAESVVKATKATKPE